MRINIKKLFTKKRIIWAAIIMSVLVLGYFLFFNKKSIQQTLIVHPGDFLQQVSASGKIITTENVDLSFEQAGIIRGVYVKVGDKVEAGKLIANQDTEKLYAQAGQMQAGIDLQKAKLNQLLAGSTPEDIKIKEDAVFSEKQDLQNAYAAAVSNLTSAYSSMYNAYIAVTYIDDIYFTLQYDQGKKIQRAEDEILDILRVAKKYLDDAKNNNENITSAIEKMASQTDTIHDNLNLIRELMDDSIFHISGLTADKESLDTQKTNINAALADILSSQQDVVSAQAALQQAENQLESIKATPRTTDVAVYEAQIRQASASLQEIYAQIREKQVIAPISGTVAAINAESGSIMGPGEIAASIISDGKFQIESYVPEIYVASIKFQDTAEITLDAYGVNEKFMAIVVSVNPAETIKDGISTYKVTLEFIDGDQRFKSGMTGNVIITTEKKSDVISVPQRIIITKTGGYSDPSGQKKFVKVKEGGTIIEREVEIGSVSSSGNTEIIFGLNDGDVVILE